MLICIIYIHFYILNYMKKALKIFILIFGLVLIFILGFIIYVNSITANINLDTEKLISFDRSLTFYDNDYSAILEQSNGRNLVEIDLIMPHTLNAFVSIEDKRFYNHNGIDYKGLLRATLNNVKSFTFKEGASTISQQLIKNTHLSNEKTIKRKLIEIKLAKQLEKKYTKKEILEKYLNTIYFGENTYGIKNASKLYFNQSVEDLSINQSAMLAGLINAPSYYSPYKNYEKCMQRKDVVLKQMLSQGYISKQQFNQNYNKNVEVCQTNSVNHGYYYMAKQELNEIISRSPYDAKSLKIYTYCDTELQNNLENKLRNNTVDAHKSAVLINKNGQVNAYFSTCGDVQRQLGSVIKPLVSYAPAIELDLVHSATKILDEKTDFNGYTPKNFNNQYYGNLSVKDSLSVSSNVCAVKLLNYVGVEKATSYLKKLNIPLSNSDNSLVLALGSFDKGVKLSEITSAYSVFNDNGYYSSPKFIKKIVDNKGKVIYQDTVKKEKVFDEATISIMNDMMQNNVKNGTAKKLSFCNKTLYAKTGTVGYEKANTDAYTISYNANHILGVWIGNKENSFLDNSITGGNTPAIISSQIWNDIIYDKGVKEEIELSDKVNQVYIDKISYEENGKIVLADEISPNRYKIKTLIKGKINSLQKSSRFSSPMIEKPQILVNNNSIEIRLCLTQYYDALVFREENGKKVKVYDTKNNNKSIFIDKEIKENRTYTYSVIPYYSCDNKTYYGKEIVLSKIKSPTNIVGDWWNE